jgi:DNA replication protein DnaC
MAADLLSYGWIERQRNVLIIGQTGNGKTWLACALAI